MTEKVVWHVVREFAKKAVIDKPAPHDLRRTCAKLRHAAGGELEQQYNGHAWQPVTRKEYGFRKWPGVCAHNGATACP